MVESLLWACAIGIGQSPYCNSRIALISDPNVPPILPVCQRAVAVVVVGEGWLRMKRLCSFFGSVWVAALFSFLFCQTCGFLRYLRWVGVGFVWWHLFFKPDSGFFVGIVLMSSPLHVSHCIPSRFSCFLLCYSREALSSVSSVFVLGGCQLGVLFSEQDKHRTIFFFLLSSFVTLTFCCSDLISILNSTPMGW